MSDEQFRQLCNTFGFAPSRALREMIDCATARAEAQRDALLEALKELTGHTNKRFTGGVWDRARAAIKAVEGEKT